MPFLDTDKLREDIFKKVSIKTQVTHFDSETIVLVSCEPNSTDAIKMLINKKCFCVEIHPAEFVDEDVAIYEFSSLDDAVTMFEALHYFRDYSVRPYLNQASDMI